MSKEEKVVINEKTFRKTHISNTDSDKARKIKNCYIKMAVWSLLFFMSLAATIVIICFTHDKPYFGFGIWGGILTFYLFMKGKKVVNKQLLEIKKIEQPFTF